LFSHFFSTSKTFSSFRIQIHLLYLLTTALGPSKLTLRTAVDEQSAISLRLVKNVVIFHVPQRDVKVNETTKQIQLTRASSLIPEKPLPTDPSDILALFEEQLQIIINNLQVMRMTEEVSLWQ